MQCNVCKNEQTELIYKSSQGSISSICELNNGNIKVYLCNNCLHVMTEFKMNHDKYYDTEYNILTQSEDEDQLYKVINNKTIFRTQHQASLLMNDFNINKETQILDFGCAKGSMMKYLSSKTEVKPYLFDISNQYIDFWKKFTSKNNYAVYKTPKEWENKFSIVTSFFSLEHIQEPILAIQKIYKLLMNDGSLYCIIPNFLVNTADLIVNEHINHFTANSIKFLLEENGFTIDKIDTESYYGAIVVNAKKDSKKHIEISINFTNKKEILQVSNYWHLFDKNILEIENKIKIEKFAIYGSGFYGSLIYSKLKNKNNFQYFIDKNPHRHKVKLFNYNIIDYDDLTNNVKNIIVGLNPNSAKDIIDNMNTSESINFFYI